MPKIIDTLVDFAGNRLTGVGDATDPTDAVNLSQLDAAVAGYSAPDAADVTGLSEAIDDRVASLLVAGANVTLTYDDGANTLTIDSAGTGGSGAVRWP